MNTSQIARIPKITHEKNSRPRCEHACCCPFLLLSFFIMRQRLTLEPRLARYFLWGRAHLELVEALCLDLASPGGLDVRSCAQMNQRPLIQQDIKKSSLRQYQISHCSFGNCDLLSLTWYQRRLPKIILVSLRPKGRDLVVTSCLGLRTQRFFVYIL